MQFRLVYQGRLRSNGDSRHKQEIRRALQPQMRELWTHPPLDRTEISLDYPAPLERVSVIHPVGDFWFAPLVCEEVQLLAELDVTMLRPLRPGGLLREGGDIDNQLKTLFDALRVPAPAEIPEGDTPGDDERPFFCLLDDDERIVDLRVSVDRYLNAPDDHSVHVLMVVKTRPARVIWGNLPLA